MSKTKQRVLTRGALTLPEQSVSFLRDYLRTIGTPYADTLLKVLKCRDFRTLVTQDIDPSVYTDAEVFKQDYLAAKMLSKFSSFELGIDRAQVALDSFRESERECARVNRDIYRIVRREHFDPSTPAVLFMARRKIHDLLGDYDWDEASTMFAWGPGASTSKRRQHADAYYKFGLQTEASINLAPLVPSLLKWYSSWSPGFLKWKPEVTYVSGSKGTTVPKNAKTDRFIAIEPDLNLLVQKGIGGMIRHRLQRKGLLTPDAQEQNARLAREGSVDGCLATIDLKAASDSISMKLVEELLPEDWVEAIKLCRSPVCVLPSGEKVVLQKVSSMGNGFTFELETLIFWALASSWIQLIDDKERRVKVYGDDIIMSSSAAPAFVGVLKELGFVTNEAKSYWDGPFRESCGKHYFRGRDVTPFYIQAPVDIVPRAYWLANSIALWSMTAVPGYLDSRYKGLYDSVVKALPPAYRTLPIPLSAGSDTGLYTNWDEAQKAEFVCWSRRYQRGWLYQSLRQTSVYLDKNGLPRLLKSLQRLEAGRNAETHITYDSTWKLLTPEMARGFADTIGGRPSLIRSGITKGLNLWVVSTGRRRSWCAQWSDLGIWV